MDHIEFARLGGKARAKALTKSERSVIARLAGIASGKARKRSIEHTSKSNANQVKVSKINNNKSLD